MFHAAATAPAVSPPPTALPDLHNLTIDAVRADGGRGRTPHMRRLTRSTSLTSNVRPCRSRPHRPRPGGSRPHPSPGAAFPVATGPAPGTPPISQVPPFRRATGPAPGPHLLQVPPFRPATRARLRDPTHFSRCRLSGRRPGRLPRAHPFPRCRLSRQSPTATTLRTAPPSITPPRHPTPATQLARTCLRSMTNVSCSVAGAGSSVLFRPPPHLPWWVQSMRQGAERR